MPNLVAPKLQNFSDFNATDDLVTRSSCQILRRFNGLWTASLKLGYKNRWHLDSYHARLMCWTLMVYIMASLAATDMRLISG
eukprot:scaffold13643_cov32-Prasinocladus_malaysianus.AAC.1